MRVGVRVEQLDLGLHLPEPQRLHRVKAALGVEPRQLAHRRLLVPVRQELDVGPLGAQVEDQLVPPVRHGAGVVDRRVHPPLRPERVPAALALRLVLVQERPARHRRRHLDPGEPERLGRQVHQAHHAAGARAGHGERDPPLELAADLGPDPDQERDAEARVVELALGAGEPVAVVGRDEHDRLLQEPVRFELGEDPADGGVEALQVRVVPGHVAADERGVGVVRGERDARRVDRQRLALAPPDLALVRVEVVVDEEERLRDLRPEPPVRAVAARGPRPRRDGELVVLLRAVRREVPGPLQQDRERDDVRRRDGLVGRDRQQPGVGDLGERARPLHRPHVERAHLGRVEACQERRPAWRADGRGDVGALVDGPLGGESVEVRRPGRRVAVGREDRAQVVGDDPDDVGPPRLGRPRCLRRRRAAGGGRQRGEGEGGEGCEHGSRGRGGHAEKRRGRPP